MIVMLLFGWMLIACSFIIYSFGDLAIKRHQMGSYDTYFWLCLGSFLVAVGLAEFAITRVYQSMFLEAVPFVQVRAFALVATSTILAGLVAKVKALSLNDDTRIHKSRIGRRFVLGAVVWAAFTVVWSIL